MSLLSRFSLNQKEIVLGHYFGSIEQLIEELSEAGYVADRALATVLFLADCIEKPIFLEGEPGVGKTEIAVVLSRMLGSDLIRLQCYEGLDASTSLYEWNYPKQILRMRLEGQDNTAKDEIEKIIYSPDFLIKRPLLEAILRSEEKTPVLLIDEIDRSDEEFEAFLLEVLADFQITIPEIGTIQAKKRPLVVITSNRTRDVHDALKRRCLYHWIDYPSFEKEYMIIMKRLPGIESDFAKQITGFIQKVREEDLMKRPGVSETLDWGQALMAMHKRHLDEQVVTETIGCILKYREDIDKFREEIWSDSDRKAAYI
ncbi:MAG: MoxR family ATPase [Thermodesulfobacteriota bacterium]|nr:MoxR family ATPase [Thermodesulfobacteriota bacterium]